MGEKICYLPTRFARRGITCIYLIKLVGFCSLTGLPEESRNRVATFYIKIRLGYEQISPELSSFIFCIFSTGFDASGNLKPFPKERWKRQDWNCRPLDPRCSILDHSTILGPHGLLLQNVWGKKSNIGPPSLPVFAIFRLNLFFVFLFLFLLPAIFLLNLSFPSSRNKQATRHNFEKDVNQRLLKILLSGVVLLL